MVAELVAEFFHWLYPLPSYAFFHKATIVKRCNEATIDESVKLSLCAITAQQLGKVSLPSTAWVEKAQNLIFQNLERPSIFHLQTLLLLIRYRASAGQFPTAFMLSGLAARLAMALRLNYERSDVGAVAQEVRRRTFWSLYLLEDIFCVGLKEFELCRPDIIQLQLPCEDVDFENERSVTTGSLRSDGGRDSETISDRGQFLRLNRRVYLNEIDAPELISCVRNFETALQQYQTQIRPFGQYAPDQPVPYQVQPQTVMCYMSVHQCYCDLYRIFLTGYTDAAPQVAIQAVGVTDRAMMGTKCLENAEKIVQILIDFNEQNDRLQLLDSDAAVCAYHGTRLVLFGSFSHRGNFRLGMQLAISRAKACLDILSRMFVLSHSVKPMLNDLGALIQRYETSLTLSSKFSVSEQENNARPRREVSEHARARQRLSVHSLLLQAGFVDDSQETAESFAQGDGQFSTGKSLEKIDAESTAVKAPPHLCPPLFFFECHQPSAQLYVQHLELT
ncbi:Fungal specific transcription factor domain-containing protein isoform 2 [Cladophialophora immunda]|nr:Fungal specific transcription factor domain-containing protein isoform 2 [Cladophialophora immunda]